MERPEFARAVISGGVGACCGIASRTRGSMRIIFLVCSIFTKRAFSVAEPRNLRAGLVTPVGNHLSGGVLSYGFATSVVERVSGECSCGE